MPNVIPTAFSASPVGFAAIASSSASTAAEPRFILSPWSPSPIAWSSAVSSEALAMTRSAATAISDLKTEGSRGMTGSLGGDGDAPASYIKVERVQQSQAHLLACPERLVRIGQGDKGLPFVVEMHVVLVAEMLDPAHSAHEASAVRLADLQMLCSHADSLCMTRHGRLGQ